VPRPLLGTELNDGDVSSGSKNRLPRRRRTAQTSVASTFVAPSTVAVNGPQIPLVSLAATLGGGGTLHGGQILYYASQEWMHRI